METFESCKQANIEISSSEKQFTKSSEITSSTAAAKKKQSSSSSPSSVPRPMSMRERIQERERLRIEAEQKEKEEKRLQQRLKGVQVSEVLKVMRSIEQYKAGSIQSIEIDDADAEEKDEESADVEQKKEGPPIQHPSIITQNSSQHVSRAERTSPLIASKAEKSNETATTSDTQQSSPQKKHRSPSPSRTLQTAPKGAAPFAHLSALNLSHSSITPLSASCIFLALTTDLPLISLSLSHCPIFANSASTSEDCLTDCLVSMLRMNVSLISLDLSFTGMPSHSARAIIDTLQEGYCLQLSSLSLGGNRGDEGWNDTDVAEPLLRLVVDGGRVTSPETSSSTSASQSSQSSHSSHSPRSSSFLSLGSDSSPFHSDTSPRLSSRADLYFGSSAPSLLPMCGFPTSQSLLLPEEKKEWKRWWDRSFLISLGDLSDYSAFSASMISRLADALHRNELLLTLAADATLTPFHKLQMASKRKQKNRKSKRDDLQLGEVQGHPVEFQEEACLRKNELLF
eukprot:MONOS_10136.1-p1 / transcript=MONOS_10136.1 / gene=MONOS_10136 / organism=Monocercomonoides_exilis_PA203 / gene_product=unspecified product / transcript_product=unspecified product / location=Mono_scaffold00448:1219-3241(+) / protein_length=512 / sequence_SO=supercontig / SO=protein_coding / is_pseudo=false